MQTSKFTTQKLELNRIAPERLGGMPFQYKSTLNSQCTIFMHAAAAMEA